MLDYDDEERFILLRKEISFYMAGQKTDAEADACVMNDLYYLLVQRNLHQRLSEDSEPQLIALAIAAYYQNYFRRTQVGLPALPVILMPGITMVHRLHFLSHLGFASATGVIGHVNIPKEETVVLKFFPPVTNKETYFSEGRRRLANQHIVLQCFEAFKASMNVTQSRVAPQVQDYFCF